MTSYRGYWQITVAALAFGAIAALSHAGVGTSPTRDLERLQLERGICAVLGMTPDYVLAMAGAGELTVYAQASDPEQVRALREKAAATGLLGKRLFVVEGDIATLHLAASLADAILVAPTAATAVSDRELLRVLCPGARALIGERVLRKPERPGTDDWSHPYHGPDNNPLSTDQAARAPYFTQFIAEPKFSPMPQVSVAAGGRVFRAFGHIAHKQNQNAVMNSLLCINSHNGTVLWRRPLRAGFMIHRNTMIATPDALYLADHASCSIIDPLTGKVTHEIVIPEGVGDGRVWKWLGLGANRLYALVGHPEVNVETKPSRNKGLGHWPWGMWQGHEYADPRTSFGFGRTFVAIDLATRKITWQRTGESYVDSRGVCMKNGRIYGYCPGKSLECLDTADGKPLWTNRDPDLLEAIGANERAQHYVTGYATSTYIKCTDNHIFFAGPQRKDLVCASAQDGKLLWHRPGGNLQLVLRPEAIYAAGPQRGTGAKLDYASGDVLEPLTGRRACTRATGSIDSIFYRASGGTIRYDLESHNTKHIAPMRPPCQDGVIISDGNLFWGPWMCGCQLSLYGHIGLTSQRSQLPLPGADVPRLQPGDGDRTMAAPLAVRDGDWPCFLGNNQRQSTTTTTIPSFVRKRWAFQAAGGVLPTAPVAVGGRVFICSRNGTLCALDTDGVTKWKAYTGSAIYYPPAVWNGRLYVGAADGRVYAFEAATGRRLWSYRIAPGERLIPVFGRLVSTWPIAGGVVVDKGTVFAAAGIAHYDGTYVAALDAVSGAVKWQNDSSGILAADVGNGVSMQGSPYVQDGALCFQGGGVYEIARYDLGNGRCLNPPDTNTRSQFHTAFYPYYPEYGGYMSLDHTFADGRSLVFDASYEGNKFTHLVLLSPLPKGTQRVRKQASRWNVRQPWSAKRRVLWRDPMKSRFAGFAVTPDILLGTGDLGTENSAFLVALRVDDGSVLWRQKLPARPVKGGVAVDHDGRIYVALKDGQVLCYTEAPRPARPKPVSTTPPAGALLFADDFGRQALGDAWSVKGVELVGDRIETPRNLSSMETRKTFSGDLQIDVEVDKEGSHNHSVWDFTLALPGIGPEAAIQFDADGVDRIKFGDQQRTLDGGAPNRGTATLVYINGYLRFSFKNILGSEIHSQWARAKSFDETKVRIGLAGGGQHSRRCIDNVRISRPPGDLRPPSAR